ncbi:MAG: hypothetical protein AAGJ31_12170 [Verrucomicrobiota bacterium]
MNRSVFPFPSVRGSASTYVIWGVVAIGLLMLVRGLFSPEISVGMASYEVKHQLGEPDAKSVIPRPG